ncbi:alginate export family protein [Aureivirga sp. CE67]|uniref:alginate export family protein n=1 Tax=Aureivirga sp. CE67 TaxID=1788983 RepID=UPI0018C905A7|nr:alginate export family protein [Aureivirga sp. CE67]
MRKVVLSMIVVLFCMSVNGQEFDLSAEIRPRFENRHGFQTLFDESQDAANFISQRTRLNFDFEKSYLRLKVSLQNVRIWGDVPTLAKDDKNNSVHEAWAELALSKSVAVKFGRQVISYDDQRIFGGVDWAQQARSHDALVIHYVPSKKHRLDLGYALNADNETIVRERYQINQYKNFQYGWYHGIFGKFGLSFLILNTGFEYQKPTNDTKVDYMQTWGPRLTYKLGKLDLSLAGYWQTGKLMGNTVEAGYAGGIAKYNINNNFSIGVGYEYLSGKDMTDTSDKVKAFNPLFGTNHKFNGWMDYFYVGNPHGGVGLSDFNGQLNYKKGKFAATIQPHVFAAANTIVDGAGRTTSKTLGTEIDLQLSYKMFRDIQLTGGYSQMFATEEMELLKGGDKDATNNWVWLMITFKPNLFSIVKE